MADRPSPSHPEHLRPLTALRFAAALWVVGYDYWPRLATAQPWPLERGRLGVEVFFVLSGFVLSHVYRTQMAQGRFRYREFLWARLARIYPVHLATLAGLLGLVLAARAAGLAVGEEVVRPAALPFQLTLTQAWGLTPVAAWNHPSWSISAEWFAYLAFPAFALAAIAARRRPWLALAGAAVAAAGAYALFPALAGFPLTQATNPWGWLRIAPPFAYGCALHLVWSSWRRDAAAPVWPAALAGGGALVAMSAALALRLPDAVVVGCAGVLVLGLAALPARAARGRVMDAAVYLGEVSFALYMMVAPWQMIYENAARAVLHLPREGVLPPLVWCGLAAGVLPAAVVLHHLVERPARAWMRGAGSPFHRRGSTAAPPPATAAALHQ